MRAVASFSNLKSRVERFFDTAPKRPMTKNQIPLDLNDTSTKTGGAAYAFKKPKDFIELISKSSPYSDIYLFGGILRDIAMFGKKGFCSDIDIVIDGNWEDCFNIISNLGLTPNKFGGYRLTVAGRPIDIWHAKDTWAVARGFVKYESIHSLTKTTILNWDAILMNWRSREVICDSSYLESLERKKMDIVLLHNPNPKGAAVRVFRHLCLKDARSITQSTALYLINTTKQFSLHELKEYELYSYSNTFIEPSIYELFKKAQEIEALSTRDRIDEAAKLLLMQGVAPSFKQMHWDFS